MIQSLAWASRFLGQPFLGPAVSWVEGHRIVTVVKATCPHHWSLPAKRPPRTGFYARQARQKRLAAKAGHRPGSQGLDVHVHRRNNDAAAVRRRKADEVSISHHHH
ncbi:hypothetical protein [Camelimonas sp. ID_303_24]